MALHGDLNKSSIREQTDSFTKAYLEAAAFADCSDDDEPGMADAIFSDEFIQQAVDDCRAFRADNADLLALVLEKFSAGDQQNGHDFWLTRNGHGSGFWDRGYGEIGQRLTESAKKFPEIDVYLADDGLIYGDVHTLKFHR
jgi:hypothetical protein